MKFTENEILDYIFDLVDDKAKRNIEVEIQHCPQTKQLYEGLRLQFSRLASTKPHYNKKKPIPLYCTAALLLTSLLYFVIQPSAEQNVSKSFRPINTPHNIEYTKTIHNNYSYHSSLLIHPAPSINLPKFAYTFPPAKEEKFVLISPSLTLGCSVPVTEGKNFTLKSNIKLTLQL